MAQGQSSWQGQDPSDIEIEIDLAVLAKRLAADPAFIRLISGKVRKDLTKDARNIGNLFGKWAGK
jgi:hypothetical protein